MDINNIQVNYKIITVSSYIIRTEHVDENINADTMDE